MSINVNLTYINFIFSIFIIIDFFDVFSSSGVTATKVIIAQHNQASKIPHKCKVKIKQ